MPSTDLAHIQCRRCSAVGGQVRNARRGTLGEKQVVVHIVGVGSLGALVCRGFKMMDRASVAVSLLTMPMVIICYEVGGNAIQIYHSDYGCHL
jgi:hypothetical protein